MAIPDHVKRQAMDAINHKATTAQIRAFENSGMEVSHEIFFRRSAGAGEYTRPIPDAVKRQAMDAIDNYGTRAQIRLAEDKGSLSPVGVITPGRNPLAEKIARMHHMGHGVDSVHQAMTKDGFGREYDR